MFKAKGLFSEVVCPYEKECLLPRCLFAHPNKDGDEKAAATPPVAVQAKAESNGVNSEDGQRKRRKIDVDASSASPANRTSASRRDQTSEKAAVPSTTHRDVSPPPLKRAKDTPKVISQVKTPTKLQPKKTSTESPKAVKIEKLLPRPLTKSPATYDLRFKLLKALHEHFVRLNTEISSDASPSEEPLVLSDQQLITMALNFEEKTALEKPSIYANVVKNHIMSYKRMSVQEWKAERQKDHDASVALQNLKTKESSNGPPTGPKPKPIDTGLTPAQELAILPHLYTPITTHEASHGYVIANPTESEISAAKAGLEAAKGWEICDRCSTRFQVFPGRREEDGALASGGTCTYHWGKPFWTEKLKGDPTSKRERKWRCCGENVGDTPGCTSAPTHVFKVVDVKRLAAVMEFVETPGPSTASESTSIATNPLQPVCIDGEMGYTTLGLELIRLTATSWPSGSEIFDVLVRPFGDVLDLNTRWSGVTPEQMADALPFDPSSSSTTSSSESSGSGTELRILSSPREAQNHLLAHLHSSATPLIGHGLENDLNSLRLIHPTLIDTALLFPHRAGLPIRHGLKNLVWRYLGIGIQGMNGAGGAAPAANGTADTNEKGKETIGHDSKEDANAAGWLVRWKVGEVWSRMRTEGWSWSVEKEGGDVLVPPPASASGAPGLAGSTATSTPGASVGAGVSASTSAAQSQAAATAAPTPQNQTPKHGVKRKSDQLSTDNPAHGEVEEGELAD